MLWFSMAGINAPFAIIVPAAIYFFGIGWVVPQSNARAIQPFPNSAGTASSLLGFISMSVSALMGLLLSFLIHIDATYLSFAMLISGILASIFYWTFLKSNKKKISSSIE